MYVYVSACIGMYLYVSCVYLHAYTVFIKYTCPKSLHVYVCMCMYMYVLVCICVYHITYIQYIHIHTYKKSQGLYKVPGSKSQGGVYMCMYLYVLYILHVLHVYVCIRMYLCVLHVLYVLYVLYVCACIENSISSHTYTYIQYMHIQTYALWGAHMHCMYVCILSAPIHAI